MRCVEETTSLEQIYDETLAQMKSGNHYMLLQLLDDAEFFLRILEQEDSEVLVTFFDVAIHDGRNIKMMVEGESIAKFKAAAKNPNHEVIDVLLIMVNT